MINTSENILVTIIIRLIANYDAFYQKIGLILYILENDFE